MNTQANDPWLPTAQDGKQEALMLITFDTSALSNALHSDDGLLQVLRLVAPRYRVMVPWDVLEELLADPREDRLVPTAQQLGRCLERHSESLLVCEPGYRTVRETEWRLKFNVGDFHPLVMRNWIVAKASAYLQRSDLGEVNQPMCAELVAAQKKERSLEHDRRVRQLLPKTISVPIGTADKDKMLAGFAERILSQETHWLSCVCRSRKHLRRVRRTPDRYKSALMLASYSYLIALGAAFGNLGYPRNPGILKAPRSGDWVDATIAASSAWSDFLITDDAGQRDKVNFISEQFGWTLRALPLIDVDSLNLSGQGAVLT